MARGKRRPKRLVCRWCGDECERADDRDHRSAWTHHHPSVCPFRRDRMPALNGVHVGDVWRNLHTGNAYVVRECRLGGAGTYTDREPVLVMTSPDDGDDGRGWVRELPLWSLVEHHDPVTRPGEYPVPFHVEETGRGAGMRTADLEYRCPAYRGDREDRYVRPRAYWHSWHRMDGQQTGCIDWNSSAWQIDPDAGGEELTLDLAWGEPMNENALPDEALALQDEARRNAPAPPQLDEACASCGRHAEWHDDDGSCLPAEATWAPTVEQEASWDAEADQLDEDGQVDAFAWADRAHAQYLAKLDEEQTPDTTTGAGEQLALC